MSKSTLYLVPTPIGNLEDITIRAIRILKEVDFIYAEDTRTSGIFLKHYEIKNNLRSYHKFNEKAKCEEIINLLLEGKNIAIISDAGSPGISDPSNMIVKELISHPTYLEKTSIVPLPGATAIIPALTASGFNTDNFIMLGFLPSKKKDKEALLDKVKNLEMPICFYEAPHRLEKFLNELFKYFNNADIVIAREISKKFESWYRGKLKDILTNLDSINIKGEFVIIALPEKATNEKDETQIIIDLYKNKYTEISISKAAKIIAKETNISKNIVYETLLTL
jgi:16S rRNA (cytidine1402-2'-O)-methyltransferase